MYAVQRINLHSFVLSWAGSNISEGLYCYGDQCVSVSMCISIWASPRRLSVALCSPFHQIVSVPDTVSFTVTYNHKTSDVFVKLLPSFVASASHTVFSIYVLVFHLVTAQVTTFEKWSYKHFASASAPILWLCRVTVWKSVDWMKPEGPTSCKYILSWAQFCFSYLIGFLFSPLVAFCLSNRFRGSYTDFTCVTCFRNK